MAMTPRIPKIPLTLKSRPSSGGCVRTFHLTEGGTQRVRSTSGPAGQSLRGRSGRLPTKGHPARMRTRQAPPPATWYSQQGNHPVLHLHLGPPAPSAGTRQIQSAKSYQWRRSACGSRRCAWTPAQTTGSTGDSPAFLPTSRVVLARASSQTSSNVDPGYQKV